MSKYKVGDFVIFYESTELHSMYDVDNIRGYDLSREMLDELDAGYDNEIHSITEEGDVEFGDIEWTWPIEVISGQSPDYKTGKDGIHDVKIDDE